MTEDVAEAVALTRKLAAGRLVRKEELEAELARLKVERQGLGDGGGGEAAALAQELEARIAAKAGELSLVEGELQSALRELSDLERLGRDARAAAARATIAAARGDDPILRSPEEDVLDRVRAHAAALEAEARLGAELAEKPAEAAPAPDRKPTREEADEAARAEFEALRSRPKKTL